MTDAILGLASILVGFLGAQLIDIRKNRGTEQESKAKSAETIFSQLQEIIDQKDRDYDRLRVRAEALESDVADFRTELNSMHEKDRKSAILLSELEVMIVQQMPHEKLREKTVQILTLK